MCGPHVRQPTVGCDGGVLSMACGPCGAQVSQSVSQPAREEGSKQARTEGRKEGRKGVSK